MSESKDKLLSATRALQDNRLADAEAVLAEYLAECGPAPKARIAGLLVLSEVLAVSGRGLQSIQLLEEAQALLALPEDYSQYTSLMLALSHRQFDQGLYRQALATLLRLCSCAADAGDVHAFLLGQTGIGNLYAAYSDWRRALRYHERSLEWDGELDDVKLRINIRLHMIGGLLVLGKARRVLLLLDECFELVAALPDQALRAELEMYRGIALQMQKEHPAALHAFAEAHSLLDIAPQHWVRVKTLLHEGQSRLALGEVLAARDILRDGIALSQLHGMVLLEQHYEEALSLACEQLGDYAAALASEQRAHRIAQQLVRQAPMSELRSQSLRQLKRLEQLMRFNRSRQENQALRQAQAAQHDTLARLQYEIHTDALTGTFNRRWLDAELERRTALRNTQPFALLLIDIDHFKDINDRYSHLCGDQVLRAMGELLRRFSRNDDQAARYGGEEFVLLLRQSNAQLVLAIAERLRRLVEQHPWQTLLADRGVTISVGVALWRSGERAAELLARADQALYRAKNAGRNQVQQAD
ncbi:GGDEF domain-containing protein [Chitinilyticum piscinae]|uniref:diguanylate cyclase n=1 Tax=Chitinilyticum piscinae TaxID=2866724 RepID=A0A8J7FQQ8_9NEIS|nr:GGDEF domain-containing protein [Chitinilyticum piscinae]MBE9608991.1 GGDEF domain-containing protein [Chitinilyticum piscinae]